MNKITVATVILLLTLFSWSVAAQEGLAVSPKVVREITLEMTPVKKESGKIAVIFVGALVGATGAYDVHTTHESLSRCQRADKSCSEGNPLGFLFLGDKEATSQIYMGFLGTGIMYVANVIRQSTEHPRLAKYWWVIPVTFAAGHTLAGIHNSRHVP